jgi:hypothetical protein
MNPTDHAAERAQKRAITEDDIKRTKRQGKISLSIHLNGEEDKNDVNDEINWWADRLKEAFQQLEVGEVIEKGAQDRRVLVELRGSENVGPEIKEWLKEHNYFREKKQQGADMKEWLKQHGYSWEEKDRPHRVLFTLRRDQEEVVVVEGRSAPDTVGVITVFGARAGIEFSNSGHQVDTKGFAENFFEVHYRALLRDLNADALALDSALTEQGRARIGAASGVWVIGPGTTEFSLSTWPPSTAFLVLAAKLGRANIVDRLARHYGCGVNNQRINDGGTALHQAAYYGHADVVATLLALNADLTIKTQDGETALDSAKTGQKAYEKATDKKAFFPKEHPNWPGTALSKIPRSKIPIIDFSTRSGWPGWEKIIRLLGGDHSPEAAGVDKRFV